MIQQNNTNYTVDGRPIRRNVSKTATTLGAISLVCGIISLGLLALGIEFAVSVGYSIPIGIIGIVLGAIARKKNRQLGIAKAGLILSIIGVALVILLFVFGIILSALGSAYLSDDIGSKLYDFGSGYAV